MKRELISLHFCVMQTLIKIQTLIPKSSLSFTNFYSHCWCCCQVLQSCPTLCDPIDGAHQAPPSLGFSRQEHWSGLPFPSPMHESEIAQSCPTSSDPTDCRLRGSSVHGICQARVLEWVAIALHLSYFVTYAHYKTILEMVI